MVKKHITKTDTEIPVIRLPFPFPLHSIRWRHGHNWREVCVSHTVAPLTLHAHATGCPSYSAQNNIHWKYSKCPHEHLETKCFMPTKLFLRYLQLLSCSRNSLYFIELEGSLLCSHKPGTPSQVTWIQCTSLAQSVNWPGYAVFNSQ
jgi:hypothetical protein